MPRNKTTAWRPLAILGLPEHEVPRFVVQARSIVLATSKSSWFPSPVPPLATIAAAVDALAEAETATLARTLGTVTERDTKRMEANQLLELLRAYVQSIADANHEHASSIIESAGMSVKGKGGRRPNVFSAEPAERSGEAYLTAPYAGDRGTHDWQVSTDGMKTWIGLPSTVKATTKVTGLTPGTTVHFRHRTVTKNGTSDWSYPIEYLVR